MKLTRRVRLGSAYLDEVDERIVIRSVEPSDPRETISAVSAASGYGQRVTGSRRDNVDVVIKFAIQEHGKTVDGLQARAEVLEKVNAWAYAGGYLRLNFKPNRRLNVRLVQPASEGSLWDMTKEFQLTFRAYGVPYWEEYTANTASCGGKVSSATGTILVEGSAKTQITAELTNKSGKEIASATINIGGNSMTFSGLGLLDKEVLMVDHDTSGLVRIRIKNTAGKYRSVMATRSATSADDFIVAPGSRSFTYSTTRACELKVSWRARYL